MDSIYVADYATPQDAANAATGGKRLIFPAALGGRCATTVYECTDLLIPANCYVEGNGATLKTPANSTASSSTSDSILKVNGSGVTVDNLIFDGNAQRQAGIWSQHRHCVKAHGAFANTTVKNCQFNNIIGDGVYINVGSSTNTDVGPGNIFNGAHWNRNGVSVVTGSGVDVYGNTFNNCSRSGMPGPIDLEPNSSSETLININVYDNRIIGGSSVGTGTLPGIVYSGFQNAAADNIHIYRNDISGTRFSCGILVIGVNGGPFNAATDIDIDQNVVHDIQTDGIGIELDYWIGADVYNNTLRDMTFGIYNYKACLGTSTGNTFVGVSNTITNDDPHCS